jgi:zinc D-Ala-D-Ala dipeptidase
MCRINVWWILWLIFPAAACQRSDRETIVWPAVSYADIDFPAKIPDTSGMEKKLMDAGLVNVGLLDPAILVDLRYGSNRNFMGVGFYQGFNKCYLQKEVAIKLVNAQRNLKKNHPELTIMVWDAARPQSVQYAMWKALKPPPGLAKGFLVSNPARGSLHNFGCAVDVTLADADSIPLDMGTDFDCFDEIAWPVSEQKMLKDAKLTEAQVTNRKLLRSVMYAAGFWNIQTEWWHFNAMRREAASAKYRMIP